MLVNTQTNTRKIHQKLVCKAPHNHETIIYLMGSYPSILRELPINFKDKLRGIRCNKHKEEMKFQI